jgi:hypothetical protein
MWRGQSVGLNNRILNPDHKADRQASKPKGVAKQVNQAFRPPFVPDKLTSRGIIRTGVVDNEQLTQKETGKSRLRINEPDC